MAKNSKTAGRKIATCCYCGTRAVLVLDRVRHELACAGCGAPLHDLKSLPQPSCRKPKQGRRLPQNPRAASPECHIAGARRRRAAASAARKPRKPRKPMLWRMLDEIRDEIRDEIEDFLD